MSEEMKKLFAQCVEDFDMLTEEQQHDLIMIAKGMAIEAMLRENTASAQKK